MPFGDKTKEGLDKWFTSKPTPTTPSWGDRIKGWMASWVEKGLLSLLEAREPEIISTTRATLEKVKATPDIPPEMSELIDKALAEGDIFSVIIGWVLTLFGILPALLGQGAPLGRKWEYLQDRIFQSYRFDPAQVITAWRRDKDTFSRFFEDLKDQGWDQDRINTLMATSTVIPGVQDLVRMGVREAFDDSFSATWGTDEEFYKMPVAWAEKQGLSEDWCKRFWRSHWDLPAVSMGYEMLHRGIISEVELKQLMAALDIMPGWRDKLIEMSWNIPTRVDIRRFYEMGVIDETRLRQLYTAFGYHGADLDNYVEWTKRYVTGGATTKEKELTKAEIYKGVKVGKITRGQGVDLLRDLAYDEETASYLLAINVPVDEETATVTQRELTKADVIAGLKAAIITEAEARALLIELRYSAENADFLLKIFKATIKPPPPPDVKGLTKADILGALRAKVITQAEAMAKLLELKYTPVDADFVLRVYLASLKPSPTPAEMEASRGDITTAVKKGLITPENGYDMMIALGFSAEAAAFILAVQAAPPPPEPTPRDKEASKTDIVKAVKMGLIYPEDGYLMLQDIGFTPEASQFILMVQAEVSPFSPQSYQEFKDLTTGYRKAIGMEVKAVPAELKKAADEVVKLTQDVTALERAVAEEKKKLVASEGLPETATAHLKELEVKLHRAQAELARVKTDYQIEVAKWRQTL